MRALSFTFVLFAVVAAGCGRDDGHVKLYPVGGKVLVKGQPAPGARVVFYPTAKELDGKKLPTPAGETDASGQYRLGSYQLEDGAPVGDYKVSVIWLEPPPTTAQGIFDQKDRLGGRYSSAENSKLTARVDKGGGEIPAFELQ